MFGLGYGEIVVIVLVGLIVFGPDKLPSMAKDAGRMLKTLRDLSQGARTQLRDELGPEFGNLDLRSLNPRTALQRALFEDDEPAPRANGYAPPAEEQTRPVQRPLARGESAPYDDDAT